MEDGSITCNESSVFRKWENDFKALYNKDNPGVDDVNYVNILKEKLTLENGSQDINSDKWNREITLDEVIKIASKVKNNKSVGFDKIPNEVLKSNGIVLILTKLFNHCFSNGYVPDVWLTSVITRVPKGKKKRSICSIELPWDKSNVLCCKIL